MRSSKMPKRFRILPKTGKLREQLMAFKINNNRRRFATASDHYSFTIFNVIKKS